MAVFFFNYAVDLRRFELSVVCSLEVILQFFKILLGWLGKEKRCINRSGSGQGERFIGPRGILSSEQPKSSAGKLEKRHQESSRKRSPTGFRSMLPLPPCGNFIYL